MVKNITISGIALDESGNPIGIVNIQIIIENNDENIWVYNIATNSDGKWSLTFTPNIDGSFYVTVFWNDNLTHLDFTNTTLFNVAKASTNSTIIFSNGQLGQQNNINGIVLDSNGDPIANTPITVNVNGISYIVSTDGLGLWVLTYIPINEGLYNIAVIWGGNSIHNGFTNSSVFSVSKIPANTTVNAQDTNATQSVNINGVITDNNGDPLANAEITITINGEKFTTLTDSDGFWSLKYTSI
ncbi:hypothetical protein ALNOE001_11700 [Candidatus Methanobinarius endosymbioticus]|uniref:Bacterial Ig-like domain-containing protein n=1 Tax=Candidatus Methanobinarius endosymbioticus TaxID=2006182 RepID=A0A366MAJ7_9EURY|nr:hypothetical protein ALNOE001_11700 [Candidatus Methanobinarius endosymbioticus]